MPRELMAGERKDIWAVVSSLAWRLSVPFLLVLLVVLFAFQEPRFLSGANLQNLARQASLLAILAAGEMFPILTGGFDFSIGPVLSSASIVAALIARELVVVLGFIGGIFLGTAIGAINGWTIARFAVSPFVVTLGMYALAVGLGLTITGGQSIRDVPSGYEILGTSYLGPLAT